MRLRYSEAVKLKGYDSRLNYLRLTGTPYNSPRSISESFYKSKRWKYVRERVCVRDLGCDLGVMGHYIDGPLYVHHINPVTPEDIENDDPKLYDMENLIVTSHDTHMAIHYKEPDAPYVERTPGDTKLW